MIFLTKNYQGQLHQEDTTNAQNKKPYSVKFSRTMQWAAQKQLTISLYKNKALHEVNLYLSGPLDGAIIVITEILKAYVRYFLFFHQLIALQKLRKMLFISSKKLFSFFFSLLPIALEDDRR